MANRRIVLLSGGHLCHNPRILKEACTLQKSGFNVQIFGGWFSVELKERDEKLMEKLNINFRPAYDLTTEPLRRFWLRVRARVAKEIHSRVGCESQWQLGYFGSALRTAAQSSNADLFTAHSEQAVWAVSQLPTFWRRAPSAHRGIGVDMEDWFSEDLPPQSRKYRPLKLLKRLERKVLSHARHATCTSRAMSEALAEEYGCPPPAVIYNAFPWADRANLDGCFKDRRNLSLPSIHWYSQTIGPDRGLGDLFAALPLLNQNLEIHLRGKPVVGFESWMAHQVPEMWRKRIFIHPLVSNEELLSRIAEHDIGFAGELRYCKNKEFTVSNKILHYLLGGLAVVASDTVGQSEVATMANGAVRLYQSENKESLARQLNELLSIGHNLQMAKTSALETAGARFCWEKQEPLLLESVSKALRN